MQVIGEAGRQGGRGWGGWGGRGPQKVLGLGEEGRGSGVKNGDKKG